MRLDRYISRSRILDLGSADLEGALAELLDQTVERFPDLNREALLKGLLRRESTMTTYLGLGVAMPHVRVKMGRRYILAVGRSHYGMWNRLWVGIVDLFGVMWLIRRKTIRNVIREE